MVSLKKLAVDISDRFVARAKAVNEATLLVKVSLVLFGSTLVAIAQCAALSGVRDKTTLATVGLGGAFLALLGGFFVAFTERDASVDLAAAHKALESARQAEADYSQIEEYAEEITRATQLYVACNYMVRAIQKLSINPAENVESMLSRLLIVAEWQLRVAMGFQTADHWSVVIFQIQNCDSGRILRAVAQLRSEKCDLTDARPWPEGRGAGWMAIVKGSEVVIPDMTAQAMGTIFEGVMTEVDIKRYRSVAASPIMNGAVAWGVVIATSDRAKHFSQEPARGVQPAEAVLALQSLIGVALAARTYMDQSR